MALISRPVHKSMGGHYMLKNALKLRGTKAKQKDMAVIALMVFL